MSFYLEKIIIYNNAPFENLQLDFSPSGINVLTGLNGRGKTTILSFVVDALIELSKKAFSNEYADKPNAYYRVSSSIFSLNKEKPSLVYVRFKNDNQNIDYVNMAESLDIGTIINKKTIAASHIFQMLLDAEVDNMRSLMLVDAEVAEFTAAEGSKVTKRPVKDLGLPFGVTIGGLVRNGVGMLVNGNSQIEAGDSVMVFCHETKLSQIEKFFKTNPIW
jgi:K+/H+ antiporter YhaU regulatory subunit KhtT